MKVKILDRKDLEGDKQWLIGYTTLSDYLQSIDQDSENKFHFEVQRKIVRNIYLDKILSTLAEFEPIPFITLTYHSNTILNEKDSIELKPEEFNILDGLQRTYRLWAYWKIHTKILNNKRFEDIKKFMKAVKNCYPEFFDNGVMNSKILKQIYEKKDNLSKIFDENDAYFVIWVNLTEKEIIRKMLILNAGQKSVSSRHQFELIFLHVEKEFSDFISKNNIHIYREKDPGFRRLKNERKVGEYALSSLITALLSLATGKPQRISSELIYKYDLMEEERTLSYAEDIFSDDFMKASLKFLLDLDKKYENNKEVLLWLGKDTTLTGMFSAIGKYIGIGEKFSLTFSREEIIGTFEYLLKLAPPDLRIKEFNSHYNSVAGRSINIGMYIRNVVQYYFLNLLTRRMAPSWEEAFLRWEEVKYY